MHSPSLLVFLCLLNEYNVGENVGDNTAFFSALLKLTVDFSILSLM